MWILFFSFTPWFYHLGHFGVLKSFGNKPNWPTTNVFLGDNNMRCSSHHNFLMRCHDTPLFMGDSLVCIGVLHHQPRSIYSMANSVHHKSMSGCVWERRLKNPDDISSSRQGKRRLQFLLWRVETRWPVYMTDTRGGVERPHNANALFPERTFTIYLHVVFG